MDTAIEGAKLRFKEWEKHGLPGGIKRDAIGPSDLVLAHASQKIALLHFLPSYTKNVAVVTDIVLALEYYYKDMQALASKQLEKNQLLAKQLQSETEEKYRELFENANDLIQITTPDGIILNANKAWETTLGYKKTEIEGQSIYSFVPLHEREAFMKRRAAIIKGGTSGEVEVSLVSKTGELVAIEGRSTCKFNDGILKYTLGIWRDVTKRKVYEKRATLYTEQLQEREENLRQLIEHAPDAIIVINVASEILLWNPKCEEIFGWKAQEVTGTLLSEAIIPVKHREAHLSGIKRYVTTGETTMMNKTIEITALNKNGNEFYVSLTLSATTQAGEKVFIAFLRDISKDKQKESELEARTLLLQKTNHRLEQFARLTSHDLKEPVRKILTNSDLLLTRFADQLTENVNTKVVKIMDSASRMNNLIEGILEYSSVTDEKSLFRVVELQEVIKEVLADLELMVEAKKAVITFGQLPALYANPFQMRQLFQNLISNALKYSQDKVSVKIDITSKVIRNKVQIKIKDNGIGFSNEYAEKIFEIFQRLRTEQDYEGMGIGLALCKQIVESHQGTITASSVINKGSIFVVELPVNYRNN